MPQSCPFLKDRHDDLLAVVDIAGLGLDALSAGAKEAVPDPGLLAVVEALLPAPAVVQVVILNHQLQVEVGEQRGDGRGNVAIDAEAAVAKNLRVGHVLKA